MLFTVEDLLLLCTHCTIRSCNLVWLLHPPNLFIRLLSHFTSTPEILSPTLRHHPRASTAMTRRKFPVSTVVIPRSGIPSRRTLASHRCSTKILILSRFIFHILIPVRIFFCLFIPVKEESVSSPGDYDFGTNNSQDEVKPVFHP